MQPVLLIDWQHLHQGDRGGSERPHPTGHAHFTTVETDSTRGLTTPWGPLKVGTLDYTARMPARVRPGACA